MNSNENLFSNCNDFNKDYGGAKHFILSALSMGPSYHFIMYRHIATLSHVSKEVGQVLGLETDKFTFPYYSEIRTYGRAATIFNYHDAAMAFGMKHYSLNDLHHYKMQSDCFFSTQNGRKIPMIEQLLPLEIGARGKVLIALVIHTDVSHINYRPRQTVDLISLRDNHTSHYGITVPENGDVMASLCGLLSERELDVLHLIAEGLDSKSISEKLNLSQETVKTHRKNMLRKSRRSTMYQVVSDAFREGLLS